jgi:hypothetical protein
MASRRPLVVVSGVTSELPQGDTVVGASAGTLVAGSGLSGGGAFTGGTVTVDVSLAPNPSGIIFVGDALGLDGVTQTVAETALSSGNAALGLADTALSSGNAALSSAASKLPLTGGTLSGPLNVSGTIDTSDAISDPLGNVRTIPQTAVGTDTYTLVSGDVGKHIAIGSGVVTIPSGVFQVGDAVSIFNTTSGVQTISGQVGITLRQAGTTNTGQRTVDAYGLTTVLCVDNTEVFVIAGAGIL